MDKQFRIADKARSSLQELTNDFQRALTANGFLRGRGIRMRLLHQHICAITGDSRCARQMQDWACIVTAACQPLSNLGKQIDHAMEGGLQLCI